MPPLVRTTFSLRWSTAHRRLFHTTVSQRASILFALGALSNSRETQHFNKISRLSRIEHSPVLKLIKTSEVDAYPLPMPPPTVVQAPWLKPESARSAQQAWDHRALRVGRTVLADQARQTRRLQLALARSRRREAKRELALEKARYVWQTEATRLRNDMRVAGVWILLSMGTATALATWRFWPQQAMPTLDSADIGRKIAASAKAAIPLPAVTGAETAMSAAMTRHVEPAVVAPKVATAQSAPIPTPSAVSIRDERVWWKNMFWKQQ